MLHHKHTKFENPHGLSNKNQKSNVWELSEACFLFLQNQVLLSYTQSFRTISSCQHHSGRYYNSQLAFQWENTNSLLWQGYEGVKTGITATAGGCLASLTTIQLKRYEWQKLLVVVLGCQGAKERFSDTKKVVEGYQEYLKMMRI